MNSPGQGAIIEQGTDGGPAAAIRTVGEILRELALRPGFEWLRDSGTYGGDQDESGPDGRCGGKLPHSSCP